MEKKMITRREMLRSSLALGGAALFAPHLLAAVEVPEDRRFAERLRWYIGPHIYSFNKFPFDEALKMVAACGVTSFEQFPGQRVSKDIGVGIGPDLLKPENKDALKKVKDLLAEYGCKTHSIGVSGSGRADFDFAAEFKIPLINTEPGFDHIAELSKLTEEYKINAGLHNHPKDSIYWNPEIVLKQLQDASPRIGACCDTGHWLRSGLNPLECIKQLKGRIVGFHFKDLKENHDADCILGQGAVGVEAILKEVASQNIRGPLPFSIEFEADWDKNQPKVAECIKVFDSIAKEIVQSRPQRGNRDGGNGNRGGGNRDGGNRDGGGERRPRQPR
jgi:sugar phosphate isomerase/epimerase